MQRSARKEYELVSWAHTVDAKSLHGSHQLRSLVSSPSVNSNPKRIRGWAAVPQARCKAVKRSQLPLRKAYIARFSVSSDSALSDSPKSLLSSCFCFACFLYQTEASSSFTEERITPFHFHFRCSPSFHLHPPQHNTKQFTSRLPSSP